MYLVLAFLQMAPVVMSRKHPSTELETMVLPCLKINADIRYGGKNTFTK